MRPPEFTGGNSMDLRGLSRERKASMRPPEFTGGNPAAYQRRGGRRRRASMRPPEFTGGNPYNRTGRTWRARSRFNEAAGIHRRKRRVA